MTTRLRSKSGHYASVYSPERLEEIGSAVQVWFDSLPTPKIEAARSLLKVSQQAVHRWRRRKGGPMPIYMYRLWKDTGNHVFQLTVEERDLCLHRGQEIPNDFPTRETEKQAFPLAETSPDQLVKTSVPLASVEGQMTHNLVILQAFMLALDALAGLNGEAVTVAIRQQAAKIVLQMFRIFRLKAEDFKLIPQEENDPDRRGVIEKLLGKVVFAKSLTRKKEST